MQKSSRNVFLYLGAFFGILSVLLILLLLRLASQQNGKQLSASKDVINSTFFSTPTPTVTPTPSPMPLPKVKILTGGNQVFQTFNNCGPASLSMTLSLLGIRETQQTLGQQIRPYQNPQGDNDDKSVTLLELAKKAEEYGFVTYRRPAGDVEIVKKIVAQDLPVITRTWLKTGDDIGHYRVIKGYDENAGVFIQDDSLQGGNLKYSYQEFLSLWEAFNYEFLVLVPKDKQDVIEQVLGEYVDEQSAWQKSLAISEKKLAQQPNDIYAQFNKSVALYYLGDYAGSVLSYERVESKLPMRMLWYQLEPVLAYYKLGQNNRVLQISNKILSNHNRAYSELYYLQEQIYRQQGNISAADTAAQNAVRYNGSSYWKSNVQL